jgi:hypothetical protein
MTHDFPTGAAPGWGPRPSYGLTGWLPYGSKDRYHGYRPWRQARQFEGLQSRLYGNRLCQGGDPWCPLRNGVK